MRPRHGIRVRAPRDRGAEILHDPDGYFRRARTEAAAVVERDMARQRPMRRSIPPMIPIPEAAKAYIALAGSLATALLGVFTTDTIVGRFLTIVAVVATAFATYRVPNHVPGRRRNDEA